VNQGQHIPNEKYGRHLAAASYPRVEAIPDLPLAFLRKWALRFSRELPSEDAVAAAIGELEAMARQEVAKASGLDNIEPSLIALVAIPLSNRHLALEIRCPNSDARMGDAAAIVTFSALQGVDRLWSLADVQGIPKSYWWFVRP
jgi:hypothetical protein